MAITVTKRYRGQQIINDAEINLGANGGSLNIYADDGTLLITGDEEGFTVQDSDGTRRSRLGVQPDGSRDVANVTTKPGVDLVDGG